MTRRRAPSESKTSIAVWVGLYPTAVLLTLAMSPARLPLWQGMLIGNLLSSFVDELRHDAVLCESAAQAVAAAAAGRAGATHELAWHAIVSSALSLGGRLLSRHQGVLAPALGYWPPSGAAAATPGSRAASQIASAQPSSRRASGVPACTCAPLGQPGVVPATSRSAP